MAEVTPHAFISHISAAKIHGFHLPLRFEANWPVDVARRAGEGKPRRSGVTGRELIVAPGDITIYAGVPVTSLARTLLDIAGALSVEELVVVADQLVCEHNRSFGPRVYPRIELAALKSYVQQRSRHRGMRELRAALDLARVGADSPRETQLRLIIGSHPLPVFEHNVEIVDCWGRGKVCPDLACKEYKCCAEYDGRHHFTAQQQAKDHDRDYITRQLGWHQVLINNDDMRVGADVVVTKIARALRLGGWPDPLGLADRSLGGLLANRKDFT